MAFPRYGTDFFHAHVDKFAAYFSEHWALYVWCQCLIKTFDHVQPLPPGPKWSLDSLPLRQSVVPVVVPKTVAFRDPSHGFPKWWFWLTVTTLDPLGLNPSCRPGFSSTERFLWFKKTCFMKNDPWYYMYYMFIHVHLCSTMFICVCFLFYVYLWTTMFNYIQLCSLCLFMFNYVHLCQTMSNYIHLCQLCSTVFISNRRSVETDSDQEIEPWGSHLPPKIFESYSTCQPVIPGILRYFGHRLARWFRKSNGKVRKCKTSKPKSSCV